MSPAVREKVRLGVATWALAVCCTATGRGGEPQPAAAGGLAARFIGDAGIEQHPAVIMADDFEGWPPEGLEPPRATWTGIYRNATNLTHVVDGTVTIAGRTLPGTKILGVSAWHGGDGRHVGGVMRHLGNYSRANEGRGDGYEEIYVRFYMKFDETYRGVGNHGTNLGGRDLKHPDARWAGMSNTRDVASQGYFFTGLQPYEGIGQTRGMRLGFYSYHMDKPDEWGDNYGLRSLPLEVGRWYCVERRLKLNAVEPPAADGVEQLWVDGVLQITKEGLRFRRSPSLRITFFALENYYERLAEEWTPEHPVTVLYDNVVVARQYIGPIAVSPPAQKTEQRPLVNVPAVDGQLAARSAEANALLQTARGAEAAGQAEVARRLYVRIVLEYSETEAAEKAFVAIERLGGTE